METFFTRKNCLSLINQYWMTWSKLRNWTSEKLPRSDDIYSGDKSTSAMELPRGVIYSLAPAKCLRNEKWQYGTNLKPELPATGGNRRKNFPPKKRTNSKYCLYDLCILIHFVQGRYPCHPSHGQSVLEWWVFHLPKKMATVLLIETSSALSVWKEGFLQRLIMV